MGTLATGPTNLAGQETKRAGLSTKRAGLSTKHAGLSTKGFAEEMTEQFSKFGAYGDYTVKTPEGELLISGAIAIRVLDHGELNLVTDTGRWFLFAANSWTKVIPTQPAPGKVGVV
jgi:hypothetical protein